MITWMQRHRKYLVITIWISTFAFIGAGFVGWGQYDYGDKAGAVAKVGDITISQREWQQSYSRLYEQYSKVFQGNFDKEQAKGFGLEQQALRQNIEKALILNLANSYNLEVTKEELSKIIVSQEMFYDNGKFSKELYLKVLKQNRMNVTDYEDDIRQSILIQKVLSLFQSEPLELEKKVITTAQSIADKVEYKVLDSSDVTLDTSDEKLKAYWENQQQNYMNAPSYTIEYIIQEKLTTEPDEAAISEYYSAHRTEFTDAEGKILEPVAAKALVIAAIDAKATNKQALRSYIAFKKEKLDSSVDVQSATISEGQDLFGNEILTEVANINITSPYLKPRKIGEKYVVIKLKSSNPATPKSFEEAKADVLVDYTKQQSSVQLQKLANEMLNDFSGTESDFLTQNTQTPLMGLNQSETQQFVAELFSATQKKGFIPVSEGKLVLFNIIDQKILATEDESQVAQVARLKASIFNDALLKMLESKYKIESFVEGN